MNKKDFIKKFQQVLSEDKTITKSQKKEYSQKTTDIFFDTITHSLQIGDKIDLRKFGTFQIKKYKFSHKEEKFPTFKMSQMIRKKLKSNQ